MFLCVLMHIVIIKIICNANFYIIFLFVTWLFTASNANASGNEMTLTTPIMAVEIAAEEGRLRKAFNEAIDSSESLDLKFESSSHTPINYPVGKPLEVKIVF